MSWMQSMWNPFKKKDGETSSIPEAKKEESAAQTAVKEGLAETAEAKGMMGLFYRKWKDPSFVKQLRTLAAYMQKDGVDLKNMADVKAWLEKNKADIDSGKFKEAPPAPGAKIETFVKTGPDVGRNDPCTCGSGKKYKKCCGTKS